MKNETNTNPANTSSKFGLTLLLILITLITVIGSSLNLYWFEKTEDFLWMVSNQVVFEDTGNTCLIHSISIKNQLNAAGIKRARILAFHCVVPDGRSFGHAVCIFELGGSLFVFDLDGSQEISKDLSHDNIESRDPARIISFKYNYVKAARWIDY